MVIGTPVVLNLIPGGVNKVVHVNQVNDNIEIQFQIMNGSQPYNVTEGVSCTIRGTKGDSYGYTAEAATTVGSNVVTVTLTEQLTAVAGGCNVFELVFVGAENSMKVSTENFILAVERAALGEDTVISDSDLAYAEQVLDQLQSVGAVNAQVQQNKANIAAETTRATAAEQTLQQNINSEASARQTADNTLQSNINAEASARAAQDTVLQAEIDQLVAPSGSAPSAAEVTNARIGADGTTYPTLGDAIRTQVTDVKTAFNTNLYNKTVNQPLVDGEYVTSTTGVITQDATYSRTQYIDVTGAQSIKLEWTVASEERGVTLNAICFYDASKSYIDGYAGPLSNQNDYSTIQILDGASYAIFSGRALSMSQVVATLLDITSPLRALDRAIDIGKADKKTAFSTEYVTTPVLIEKIDGVIAKPGNLVDYSDCIDGYYVNEGNGALVANANYFATGYIPVTAGVTYRSNHGRNYAWYKSDKTFLSGASGTSIQSGIEAPTNASYIRFTINKSTDGISSPLKLYFTDTTQYDTNVNIENLQFQDVWCYGKKINWIGDSIVDSSDFDDYVCTALNLTQLTVDGQTGGIDGSTIALKSDGSDSRHALCERYNAMSANADLIAVSAGTNDWMYAWCPIGTINDPDDGTSNNTFYGALKTLCKGLIDKYPQKVIFFTTPIKRAQAFASGAGGTYTADGVMTTPFSKNKYGKTLMDYADMIIEVCGYYSIPVLDMYRESLLNPHLTSQQSMFDNVYTHPNATGAKIMARRVAGWITQLGYTIEGLS